MRTVIICTIIFLFVASISYAFGDRFGAGGFGFKKFGSSPFGSGSVAEGTYWTTPMTDRWETAMTALWTTPMNTEIP